MSVGHYLYLYTPDLDYFPEDYTAFIHTCRDKGLIAELSEYIGFNHYHVGEHFLQHVSFLGCSPYLKVYPEHEQDTDYCTVQIPDHSRAVQFVSAQQLTPPRCPQCKKAMRVYQESLQTWQKDANATDIVCEHCAVSSSLYALDWRKNAGFINFAISISNIFPKEAIPSEELLSWLQTISSVEWRYFYV